MEPILEGRLSIALSDTADDAVTRGIFQGLWAYSEEKAGLGQRRPLVVAVREVTGEVLGGLSGRTAWGWLFIDDFWLPDRLRGLGLGHRILEQAEAEARSRGCHGAWLDTFSFHGAREFYARHGYEPFGELENYPVGHQRIFMQKRLTEGASPGA